MTRLRRLSRRLLALAAAFGLLLGGQAFAGGIARRSLSGSPSRISESWRRLPGARLRAYAPAPDKAAGIAALSAAPLPPAQGGGDGRGGRDQGGRTVAESIDALRQLFADGKLRDLPAPETFVGPVAWSIHDQLSKTASLPGRAGDPVLGAVADHARGLLGDIGRRLRDGEIDPRVKVRTSPEDPQWIARSRELRVGFYPVAADPFHWAHLLVGLQAVARLGLDKVVFVPAGDDPRKPAMTQAAIRHPMGRAVLAGFSPFFSYSPLALGTAYDGETNLFRFLALNAGRRMDAFYIVGDDHYRETDKNGKPDTIRKIESNQAHRELAFDGSVHSVSLAFNERDGRGAEVRTDLRVEFLPKMPFPASSTQVRKGEISLMPYSAYDFVRSRKLGLYGISDHEK